MAESATNSNALSAREIEWAKNSPELLEEHAAINKSIVRTRFPREFIAAPHTMPTVERASSL